MSMGRLSAGRSVRIVRLLKQAGLEWYTSRTFELGAALAFYAIFSIAPVIVLAFTERPTRCNEPGTSCIRPERRQRRFMPNRLLSACNHGNGRPTRSWSPPRAAAQETASRLAPVVGGRPDAGRDAHVRFVRQRAIRSGTRYGEDLPARPGNAVILVEAGGRRSDERD